MESTNEFFDTISELTTKELPQKRKKDLIQSFAFRFGWHPSDFFDIATEFTNGHIIVEHGMDITSVISFIKAPYNYNTLTFFERQKLNDISYNNLIDIHIPIGYNNFAFVFNRRESGFIIDEYNFEPRNFEKLRSSWFEKIVGNKPNPNLPALDDALIGTISYWKRIIFAELNYGITNDQISQLFNAIILCRAIEDQFKKVNGNYNDKMLIEILKKHITNFDFYKFFQTFIKACNLEEIPEYLIGKKLSDFNKLSKHTINNLFLDFYENKYAKWINYDFSLISKHALSKIYEKYVSLLKIEETPQQALFNSPIPFEEINKESGCFYTPQYLARFFSRYLLKNIPFNKRYKATVLDPAVGSGIFLRSYLETICEPELEHLNKEEIKDIFNNIHGSDKDPNACNAARLSLALLYFTLTNELPSSLNIFERDILLNEDSFNSEKFDIIITNPPFIPRDKQKAINIQLKEYLKGYSSGKSDLYLAFIKLALNHLKTKGIALFVLPQAFLISKSATTLREQIAKNFGIKFLGDLSDIEVFKDVGVYIILFVFDNNKTKQFLDSTILKCHRNVGHALYDVIQGIPKQNEHYSIYNLNSSYFNQPQWYILSNTELEIHKKLVSLPKLKDFLMVKQGIVTGNDKVFILSKENIPKGEEDIYMPLLQDREMCAYVVPTKVSKYILYPYKNGKKIPQSILEKKYNRTWSYLLKQKNSLTTKNENNEKWFYLHRPRDFELLQRAKIVTPYVVLLPKFSLDIDGKYGITRAPFLIANDCTDEIELLKYFVAVLNSTICFWYLSTHARKQQHNYVNLLGNTLMDIPVPNIYTIPRSKIKQLTEFVDLRLRNNKMQAIEYEKKIDVIVSDLYGISYDELKSLGLVYG